MIHWKLSVLVHRCSSLRRREGCRLCYRQSLFVFLIFIACLTSTQNYDFPNNCEDYIHRIGRTGVRIYFTSHAQTIIGSSL